MTERFAIVELMGHRRYGARVSEVEQYGAKFLRAEVLTEPPYEQLVHPQALYAITPCTEEQARRACRYTTSVLAQYDPPKQLEARVEPDDEGDAGRLEEDCDSCPAKAGEECTPDCPCCCEGQDDDEGDAPGQDIPF
jgi:hypothetical protein